MDTQEFQPNGRLRSSNNYAPAVAPINPDLAATKIRPRTCSRGPTISASGYIRPLPSQFILSRTIATLKLRVEVRRLAFLTRQAHGASVHPHFLECRFDVRDLGAVLDDEEPSAPSGMRSSAVASLDHRRSVAMRRLDGRGTHSAFQVRAPRGRAGRGLLEQCAVLLSLMSALQRITDSTRTSSYVRKVPLGDITCRHNHPSGDATLSQAEIRMTKAIIDIASQCTITSSSARTGMPA